MHNIIDNPHCNSHKTSTIIIIIILIVTVIITSTNVINFNRYLLKRLNTIFEKLLVLRFTPYYKIRQSVVTIYDSSDYYFLRQHVITIYDGYIITIHDTCYNISRQVLQFTTSVITIHDRYYNSRQVWLQFTTGITVHDIITFHDRTHECFYNSIETATIYFVFLLENSPRKITENEENLIVLFIIKK